MQYKRNDSRANIVGIKKYIEVALYLAKSEDQIKSHFNKESNVKVFSAINIA